MERRLGICVSYYCGNPRATTMLRLLIESLERHCQGEYAELVIVDDCSPPSEPNDSYLADLVASGRATVYRLGPPRVPYHRKQQDGSRPTKDDSKESNFGHAVGIMAGLHRLRELGCTHGWVIDADCIVLDGDFLRQAMRLFDHEKVAVVNDYFAGRPPATGQERVCDEICERTYEREGGDFREVAATDRFSVPVRVAQWLVGFPVLFCGIVDLSVERDFGQMSNAGWVNTRWGYRMFRAGYRCGYYPFFQGRHVFHLGLGFSSHHVPDWRQPMGLGNVKDVGRYGGKSSGIYHAGYLQLAIPQDQYLAYLDGLSLLPFDERIKVKREWFADPPPLPLHGRSDPDLRPFFPSDLDALCEIDRDPEVCRFLQWGPHGRAASAAFLDKAVRDRRRFFAFSEGGKLVGYGEATPDLEDPLCVWLTYVLARSAWHRGLGKALVTELVGHLSSVFDYGTFRAAIDLENEESLRCVAGWTELREETYELRGVLRRRKVFQYGPYPVRPSLPGVESREDYLFGSLGIWPSDRPRGAP